MDSRQPAREKLGAEIMELLRSHRLTLTVDEDGNGFPLVDVVTPKTGETIRDGIEELEYLAGEIAWLVIPEEAPNET